MIKKNNNLFNIKSLNKMKNNGNKNQKMLFF